MIDKKQKSFTQEQTTPKMVFCKFSKQFIFRGRWNWECKCIHCHLGGQCESYNIVHKARYIPEAKKRREKSCKRCFYKTKLIQEKIKQNQNNNQK